MPVARHVGREVPVPLTAPLARSTHEHQDVVDDGPVGRPNLDRLHPRLGRQPRLDDDVLVRHRAGRLDGNRLRQLDDQVRRADGPIGREGARQRGVGRVAGGQAVLQPTEQVGLVGGRQRPVVGPPARGVRGVPRRHRPGLDDLADHPLVRGHVGQGVELERPDAAVPVALDAVRQEDAADAVVVRHRRETRLDGRLQVERTARRGRRGDGHRLPGEQGREGGVGVPRAGGVEGVPEAVLVVDGPAVDEGPLRVQDEQVAGRGRPQPGGEGPGRVGEVRPLEAVYGDGLGDRGRVVRGDRVDVDEGDPPPRELGFELRQRRQVLPAQRATRTRHRDDDRLRPPRQRGQRHRPATDGRGRQIRHQPPDPDRRRRHDPRSLPVPRDRDRGEREQASNGTHGTSGCRVSQKDLTLSLRYPTSEGFVSDTRHPISVTAGSPSRRGLAASGGRRRRRRSARRCAGSAGSGRGLAWGRPSSAWRTRRRGRTSPD